MQVNNRSVNTLCQNIIAYLKELKLSNSAKEMNFIPQDLDRFDYHATVFSGLLDKIQSETHLDTPHSNKHAYDIAVPDYAKQVDNPNLQSICDFWITIINELVNCQSKTYGSGLLEFDYNRAKALVQAVHDEIASLRSFGPVDMPEFHTQSK